jgi:hypothetical protein
MEGSASETRREYDPGQGELGEPGSRPSGPTMAPRAPNQGVSDALKGYGWPGVGADAGGAPAPPADDAGDKGDGPPRGRLAAWSWSDQLCAWVVRHELLQLVPPWATWPDYDKVMSGIGAGPTTRGSPAPLRPWLLISVCRALAKQAKILLKLRPRLPLAPHLRRRRWDCCRLHSTAAPITACRWRTSTRCLPASGPTSQQPPRRSRASLPPGCCKRQSRDPGWAASSLGWSSRSWSWGQYRPGEQGPPPPAQHAERTHTVVKGPTRAACTCVIAYAILRIRMRFFHGAPACCYWFDLAPPSPLASQACRHQGVRRLQ